jgi:hypothetical protein
VPLTKRARPTETIIDVMTIQTNTNTDFWGCSACWAKCNSTQAALKALEPPQ